MILNEFLKLVDIVCSAGGTYHWCAHPVFDGAPSPAKANEDARRRAERREHLNEATRLEAQKRGTTKEALKHYNAWWRPSPLLVHEICKKLSSRCIPFTVAPHEADGQISYLCSKARPGSSIAITVDSDLAVSVPNVFFWDRQYGVQYFWDGEVECTALSGQRYTVYNPAGPYLEIPYGSVV